MHYAGFDCKRTVPLQSLSGEETLIKVIHHGIHKTKFLANVKHTADLGKDSNIIGNITL